MAACRREWDDAASVKELARCIQQVYIYTRRVASGKATAIVYDGVLIIQSYIILYSSYPGCTVVASFIDWFIVLRRGKGKGRGYHT